MVHVLLYHFTHIGASELVMCKIRLGYEIDAVNF